MRLRRWLEDQFSALFSRLDDLEAILANLDQSDPRWVRKPPSITNATLGTVSSSSAFINDITFSEQFSNGDSLFVALHSDPDLYTASTLDGQVAAAYAVMAAGTEFTDLSTGSVEVNAFETPRYATLVARISGRVTLVEPSSRIGPFTAGAGALRQFNWNPGLYIGVDTIWEENGVQLINPTRQQVINRYQNATWLQEPWRSRIKGVRTRFHWRELEPQPGVFHWEVIDALLELLEPIGGRILVTADYQANNKHAGSQPETPSKPNLAGPPDLVDDPNEFHWFNRGNAAAKPRSLARMWDPTIQARARYQALMEAILDRYGDNPRFEAIGVKGESSLGSPNKGTPPDLTFDPDANRQFLLDLSSTLLARGQRPFVMFPCNGLGNGSEELTNGRALMAFADANPGFGFRKPDCHTQERPQPHIPKTDWDRVFAGRIEDTGVPAHGRYICVWDNQNPDGNRYTFSDEHWRGAYGQAVWAPSWANKDLANPPVTNQADFNAAHGTTHFVLIINGNTPTYAEWQATFESLGWDIAYSAMPQSMVDAGNIEVVTGLT